MIKLVVSDIDGTLVPDGTDRIDPEMMDSTEVTGMAFSPISASTVTKALLSNELIIAGICHLAMSGTRL